MKGVSLTIDDFFLQTEVFHFLAISAFLLTHVSNQHEDPRMDEKILEGQCP
jgi:hypothetical protein